jgi:hypothetical protein
MVLHLNHDTPQQDQETLLKNSENEASPNLLSTITSGSKASPTPGDPMTTASRPNGVPEKFWDEQKGQLRTEALVKSYLELERKMGTGVPSDVPSSPIEYNIKSNNDLLQSDPEINKRLHSAGFSQEQAQLVYDLAAEKLLPLVGEIAAVFEAESQVTRLKEHFGGEDRWKETARQLSAWGSSHLPKRVFEALSNTYEGVVAMHRMMTGEEPHLIREGNGISNVPSAKELKAMMKDPRYWREQDPTFVEQVRDGFRKLYSENH